MEEDLEQLAYEHPVAPILEPSEITNTETKEIVTALAKYSEKPIPTTITEYTLPRRPEYKDPRNILKRALDSVKLTLFSEPNTKALTRRIQDAQTYARAEIEYKWLEHSKQKVDEALHTLHNSYTEVGEYLTNIKQGMEKAKRRIGNGEDGIKKSKEEIKNLEKDIKSNEFKGEIEELIGEEASKQATDNLEDEIGKQKKSMVQTKRESEYVKKLIRQYRGVAEACEETLKDLEPAMHRAQEQKLDLERTLHIYKGLTERQISAARAAQFLLDVRTITEDLKDGMNTIDKKHEKKLEEYNLKAPPQRLLLEPREEVSLVGRLKLPGRK